MTETVDQDVLIMSSSWEVRSIAAIERLTPRFRFAHAIVFRYQPLKGNTDAAQRESSHYEYICSSLQNLGVSVTTIVAELRQVEPSLEQLDSQLRYICGRVSQLRLIVDVTTFTKAYTLVFLRYLTEARKQNAVKAIFTDIIEPQEGSPTRGLDRIVSLPLYGGDYKQGIDTMLFLFLGFEPDRIIGLWRALEPNRTLPLFARRRDGKDPLNIKIYKNELLNRPGVLEPVEIPTAPIRAAGTLANMYATSVDEYNLAISATGNKLQCIGIYLSLQVTSVAMQVFYPVPISYTYRYWNQDHYSDVSLLLTFSPGLTSEIIGRGGVCVEADEKIRARYC